MTVQHVWTQVAQLNKSRVYVDEKEDKKLRIFLHICMTVQHVWTQVAQLNKSRVSYFDIEVRGRK
jgi:hypothetical protein